MKILALEVEAEGVKAEQFTPHLKAEARHVWELYQRGVLRESDFRADRSEAVLILECGGANAGLPASGAGRADPFRSGSAGTLSGIYAAVWGIVTARVTNRLRTVTSSRGF